MLIKKFWPCLLALAVLIMYLAGLGWYINSIYRDPVTEITIEKSSEPDSVKLKFVDPGFDLGEIPISAGDL